MRIDGRGTARSSALMATLALRAKREQHPATAIAADAAFLFRRAGTSGAVAGSEAESCEAPLFLVPARPLAVPDAAMTCRQKK